MKKYMILAALLIPSATHCMKKVKTTHNTKEFEKNLKRFLLYHTNFGKEVNVGNLEDNIKECYKNLEENMPSSLLDRLSHTKTCNLFINIIAGEGGYKKPESKEFKEYIATKYPLLKKVIDSMFDLD